MCNERVEGVAVEKDSVKALLVFEDVCAAAGEDVNVVTYTTGHDVVATSYGV